MYCHEKIVLKPCNFYLMSERYRGNRVESISSACNPVYTKSWNGPLAMQYRKISVDSRKISSFKKNRAFSDIVRRQFLHDHKLPKERSMEAFLKKNDKGYISGRMGDFQFGQRSILDSILDSILEM